MVWHLFTSWLCVTILLLGHGHIYHLSGGKTAPLCVPLRNDCQFGCHFLREAFPHHPSLAICLYDYSIKAAFLPVVHEHHEGGTLCV